MARCRYCRNTHDISSVDEMCLRCSEGQENIASTVFAIMVIMLLFYVTEAFRLTSRNN